MSPILMHIIGFILTYLVFAFYLPIYSDHKIWYDGVTKIFGIFISLAVLFVIGIIFEVFNTKTSLHAVWFGMILFAGDWFEMYFGFIKNTFSKIKTQLKKRQS